MKTRVKRVLVSLPPWPAHQLGWLCATLNKSQQEIIREALVHYGSYWKEQLEKSGRKENLD